MGIPTIKPASTTAHCMYLIPKLSTNLVVIRCAAPLSATSFQSMAPRPSINTRNPNVLPIPAWMDCIMLLSSIPCSIPTRRQTITNDINALSLNTAMSKNKRIIPSTTISRGIDVFFMFGIDKAKLKIK